MKKVTFFVFSLLLVAFSINWAAAQTIIATYDISDHASGLAYDGSYIWYGRYGTFGEWIYKFDPALGQVVDSLNLGASNVDDAYGLTWDGQYLWVCTHVGDDFTLQFDTNGTIISSFQNPSDYMSGLAWNGQDLYMGDYFNPDGAILKVTTTGQVLESWTAPDNQPWDLAWDGQNLWMADYYGNTVYEIDPVTHNVLYSFASPMANPAGVVWDGQYLWLCDEGQGYNIDHLYKIDPFGGGTPEVSLSFTSYDFGFVAIGLDMYATLGISNVGDADLTVTDLPIDQFLGGFSIEPSVTLPFTVVQGTTEQIDIHFTPFNFVPYTGTLHVMSDDPVNPDVSVNLEGFGIYAIQKVAVSTNSINFGSVWVGAGDGLTGRPFEIYNQGAVPLQLYSLTFDNPAFYATGFEPGALASMDTLRVTVYFEPEAATSYNGTMSLETNDPDVSTVDVALSGQGTAANFNQGEMIWQYEVTEPATFMGFNAITYIEDTNGDGVADVLAANDNYLTYCLNGQAAGSGDVFHTFDTGWDPMRTGPVEYERGLTAAPDLNNDGVADYVIGTGGGSRSVFAVSGSDGAQIWSFDTHNYGGEGGWIYEVTCEFDWNQDSIWDVLAAVGGPQGSSDPKSVFLLDGTNGNVIWRAALGQTVYSVRMLGNTNYDLLPEVVCGTSPGGSTYFVKMLNGFDGHELWSTQVDNVVFSLNRIEDLDNDGIYEVVAAAASGGVYALSGINGNIIWHVPSTGINYYLEVTGDLNGNGYDDVLVTSVSGTFYAYDGLTGATIWALPLNGNVLSLSSTPDFTGDGIKDACCGTLGYTFFAVSGADGGIVFSHQMSHAVDAVHWLPDVDGNGGCELLAGTRDGIVSCFSAGALASPAISLTMTPLNPPIQIPGLGGEFDFNLLVENMETGPTTFDGWIMVTLPNGTQYGPVLGPLTLTLPGSMQIDRDRTQAVPGSAPAGDYIYTGYVGQYPDVIWDQDSFPFEKFVGDGGVAGSIDDWLNDGEPFEVADDLTQKVESYELISAFPNPFNPTTAISIQLSAFGYVNLSVYDVAGRKVATLVDGYRDAGAHEVTFDGSGLASGIYLYKLKTDQHQVMGKIVLMK